MLTEPISISRKGLVDRVVAILSRPKLEWPIIAAEPDTVSGLFTRYVMIMAAIPAVISFIKMSIIGISLPFMGTMRIGIGAGISGLVVTYVLSLVGVFLVGLLIDALAPSFGGQKDQMQAMKTVAYSYTASWVASIGQLAPWLSILILLAGLIYGIYILYLGLPHTMKCPQDRAAGYAAVTIIVAIVLGWVIGMAVGAATGMTHSMMGLGRGNYTGYSHDSDVTFDKDSALGKLAEIGKQAEMASKKMETAQKTGDPNAQADAAKAMIAATLGGGSKVESLAPDQLKPFVPDTMSGLKRSNISVERSGAMGMQVSKAQATYSDGAGHSVNLEITDLGSAKGLMALAGFAGVEQNQETDHGYEKTYRNGDRWVHEKWDSSSKYGEYGVTVAERFSVNAKGSANSIDDLKSAVASINLSGLEALKDQGVQKN